MSALIKGSGLAWLQATEPTYDAATGTREEEIRFRGPYNAIRGLEQGFIDLGLSYRIVQDGPIGEAYVRTTTTDPATDTVDRYEIGTESTERSVFEHPDVSQEMLNYDAFLLATGNDTYRALAERATIEIVDTNITPPANVWPLWQIVVDNLKRGVTGWQTDFVTLRRYRRIKSSYANTSGRMSLDNGNFIYSTAQLNLPSSVAFTVPATPASTDLYQWGWRKRSQTVNIDSQYTEQVVELLFAPHTLLTYTLASGNLDW